MKVLDFNKAKAKKPVVKVATKFMFIYQKLFQGIVDHDSISGQINTLQDIEKRVLKCLDEKISSLSDIDELYYLALGVARKCKK